MAADGSRTGFDAVLRELSRRSVPVERVGAEVEHVWVRAVLELIGRSEPALAQFDREAALASVAELDRAVTASHTAAREAVAETVHRARATIGRTRRAAALLEAAPGPVIGPAAEADRIPTLTQEVRGGDVLDLGGIDGLIGGVDGALGLFHAVERDFRVGVCLLQLGG